MVLKKAECRQEDRQELKVLACLRALMLTTGINPLLLSGTRVLPVHTTAEAGQVSRASIVEMEAPAEVELG